MSDTVQLHVQIDGHVQGVGFRMFVQKMAAALDLTGWVRNRWNGGVEVLAEGEQVMLERLLRVLYEGPRGATVTDVDFEWLPASGEFSDFRVRATVQ